MADDHDTLPPAPDPMMAMAERIESKLDVLTGVAMKCFDELLGQNARIEEAEGRIAFLERLMIKPANGAE